MCILANKPTPLDARKLELEALMEARAKATQGEWQSKREAMLSEPYVGLINSSTQIIALHEDICRNSSAKDCDFIALSANQAARIAEDLIVALEALERIHAADVCMSCLDFGYIKQNKEALSPRFLSDQALTQLTRNTNQSEEK